MATLEDLQIKHEQVLQNIAHDYVPRRKTKSAKNYFEVAIERGTDPKGKPLQGGLAGLNKK